VSGIHELTAAELAASYSGGELSPVEVTRALLEHIDAWEPRLNAMYRIDRDGALKQSRDAEAAGAQRARRDGARRRSRKHLHQGRSGADRHGSEPARRAAGSGRAARRAPARGGLRIPRQDHHAGLRHAFRRRLQRARCDAQPLEPVEKHLGIEFRRRCGGGGRLRAVAPRH
jgi:hypothetical protein